MRHRRRFLALLSLAATAAVTTLLAGAGISPATGIVGGGPAAENGFPFMASLQDADGFHFCGGSVVSSRWILTAAHCVVDEGNPSNLYIVTGRTDLSDTGKGQRIRASRIVVHPSYDGQRFDAALVELSAATVSPRITLATTAHNNLEAAGTPVSATGWGDVLPTFGLFAPNEMQKVDLKVVSDAECRETNGPTVGFHAPSAVCAAELLKDTCQGDSGGPLFGKVGAVRVQIGIVSYGVSCALPKFPGVYSEVNNTGIRSWITATAGV